MSAESHDRVSFWYSAVVAVAWTTQRTIILAWAVFVINIFECILATTLARTICTASQGALSHLLTHFHQTIFCIFLIVRGIAGANWIVTTGTPINAILLAWAIVRAVTQVSATVEIAIRVTTALNTVDINVLAIFFTHFSKIFVRALGEGIHKVEVRNFR